jgi:hydrogenase/urease accessory protein HupE
MSFAAFADGFLNPLTIPSHVLAWLSVGLLIGTQAAGRTLSTLCFVAGLACGLAAIVRAVGLTPALDVLLITSAVSGALVAAGIVLPLKLSVIIAAIAGVALGLDSPPQAISLAGATTALAGTGLAAVLVFVFVVLTASRLTRSWQRLAVRILGSWIAASAMLVLALRFERGMVFAL